MWSITFDPFQLQLPAAAVSERLRLWQHVRLLLHGGLRLGVEEEEEVGADGQAAHRRTGQGQREVQAAEPPLSYLATLHKPISVARLTKNVLAKRFLLRHAWTALSQ